MQQDEARFLKRKVKAGRLDVHPTEKALVVNYELEATILGELGDPMLGDKRECQKLIRLKSLNQYTDVAALAKEVVGKCKLIHPSKLEEVEQHIRYLQSRKETKVPLKDLHNVAQLECPTPRSLSPLESSLEPGTNASMLNIDEYIEYLYEDIPEKVKGSAFILQLARIPENLEELAVNETLLLALTRVLREDGNRSIDLSTNICFIFFCFSTFVQFHGVISHFKVGSLCMEIVDYELRRHDKWKEDLERRKKNTDVTTDASSVGKREYEKSLKKYGSLVKKQDQLLRVIFYLLLNIAEDIKVEEKMRKKNIVGMLIKTIDRENADLLNLVILFLKKLSIYKENKDDMCDMNIIEKLAPHVTNDDIQLRSVILKLLFNLSFDENLRNRMVKSGLLPKLVNCLGDDELQPLALGILYHLSTDDKVKSMFTYTDCIPMLMKLVLECSSEKVPIDIMALCVNLALNKRNAQLICEGAGLTFLMKRAFQFQDALVMKMIRNISQHDGPTKTLFVEFVGDLASVLRQATVEDFIVECTGVLGNLVIPELDYTKLLQEYDLIPWIKQKLNGESCEEDLTLEVVILLSTVATDELSAGLLASTGILNSLIELLNAKQEDDEMVLQIVYVFYQMVRHHETREVIMNSTQVPDYLVDLMHDQNREVRKICDATLDIIAEYNSDWSQRIQHEKFKWHNHQWIDMVESQAGATGGYGDMDDRYEEFLQDPDSLSETHLHTNGAASPRFENGYLVNGSAAPDHLSRSAGRYNRNSSASSVGSSSTSSSSRIDLALSVQ